MNPCDKPMAAHSLTSYRYKGRYGWIMIGAKNTDDALSEARRSTYNKQAEIENLEIWAGNQYERVK